MQLKGFEAFRAKVPALAGAKIAVLHAIVLIMLALSISLTVAAYSMPAVRGVSPYLAGLSPLIAYLFIGSIGFLLAYQMWRCRAKMKAKYGPLAYQRMLPIGLAGIVWVLSLGFDLYVPLFLTLSSWAASPLWVLVLPLDAYMGAAGAVVYAFRVVVGLVLLILGVSMSLRSVATFGLDYIAVVYLYFPEESEIQDREIYSALRHPLYGGWLTLGLGGAILTFSPYSLICFLLFLLGFNLFIYWVEERELLSRFGESYEAYRRSVPAFFVKWNKIGILLGFILDSARGTE
jgi:protein-S-isoprenylcysteine O-methyltransferase Ste14